MSVRLLIYKDNFHYTSITFLTPNLPYIEFYQFLEIKTHY